MVVVYTHEWSLEVYYASQLVERRKVRLVNWVMSRRQRTREMSLAAQRSAKAVRSGLAGTSV
jgi:hypothetical protein